MALLDVLVRVAGEIPRTRRELDRLSEDDARGELIDPILVELGWRGPKKVSRSYRAGEQKQKKPDYALLDDNGTPLAFIEAKAPGEKLAKHVEQLREYASLDDVEVCALTNGVHWWLYLPHEAGDLEAGRFATLNVREFAGPPSVSAVLNETLGYESLTTGAAVENAKKWLVKRKRDERRLAEIPRAWNRLVNDSGTSLYDLVAEEVFHATGQRTRPNEIRKALPHIFDEVVSHSPRHTTETIRTIARSVEDTRRDIYKMRADDDPDSQRTARDLVLYIAYKHTGASFVELAKQVGVERRRNMQLRVRGVDRQISSTDPLDFGARITGRWYRAVCERLQLDP